MCIIVFSWVVEDADPYKYRGYVHANDIVCLGRLLTPLSFEKRADMGESSCNKACRNYKKKHTSILQVFFAYFLSKKKAGAKKFKKTIDKMNSPCYNRDKFEYHK